MKIQLKLSSNDKNISIPISIKNTLLGYDDNIQTIINSETEESINDVSDLEVRRFTLSGDTEINLTFNFWSGNTYIDEIIPLSGLTNSSEETRNSFYVMQVYDGIDENTQTKLHTGYFNAYDFYYRASGLSSNYLIDNTSEFLSLYLENGFLENETLTLYVKFLFYNARNGKFHTFAKQEYSGVTVQDDIYHTITLNNDTFKYNITGGNFVLFEMTNTEYNTLVNNTIQSIEVQTPNYPTGNTFTNEGNYIEI